MSAVQDLPVPAVHKIQRMHSRWAQRMLAYCGALRAKDHQLSEEVLAVEWLAIELTKQQAERPLIVGTRKIFRRQKEAVVQRLEEMAEQDRRQRRGTFARKTPAIVSAIFDLDFWNNEMREELSPRALRIIRSGFRRAMDRIEVEGSFDAQRPRVRTTIREIEQQSRRVNETTLDTITEIVQGGLQENESFDVIADRISEQFDRWEEWRAPLHARTAGTAAFEAGQTDAFEMADIERRWWLSQRDIRVRGQEPDDRFDHASADGQEVGIEEPFIVSGEALEYPGDPKGSAGNIINCRCSQVPGPRNTGS